MLAVQCPSDPGSCIARRPPWPPLSRGAAPPLFRSQDGGAEGGQPGAGPERGTDPRRSPPPSRAPFPVTLLLRHTRAAEAGRMGRWLQRVQVRGGAARECRPAPSRSDRGRQRALENRPRDVRVSAPACVSGGSVRNRLIDRQALASAVMETDRCQGLQPPGRARRSRGPGGVCRPVAGGSETAAEGGKGDSAGSRQELHLICRRVRGSVLARPSPDWTRPTHTRTGRPPGQR